MADHQPYAIDDWNIGIPHRPVSQHPEAALNEVDDQESPAMSMMLSQVNDGDSVTAHYLAGHQNEADDFGLFGAEGPVNDDPMKDAQGQERDIFEFGGMDWEEMFVEEDGVKEPMDIGALEMAVEGAMEREAPNAVPMEGQVGDQEVNEPMDEPMDLPQVQEMEIDHDSMELEAEPIEEDVQGPPAPIQEALSPDMKAALDAPLVDDPDSNDPDFPVLMVEAAPVPDIQEEEPASLPISAPASSSLPAAIPVPAAQDPSPAKTPASGPTPTPAPAPPSPPLAAPVPASSSSQLSATTPELVAPAPSPAETPASGSIPTPAPAPASPPLPDPASSTLPDPASSPLPAPASSPLPASTATPAETPALVPVQIPSPTDDYQFAQLQENHPAIRYAERMIEYVVIKSGVPIKDDLPLQEMPLQEELSDAAILKRSRERRRLGARRRWIRATRIFASALSAIAPAPAHIALAAPTIVPAPALLAPAQALDAPAPSSIAPTLATIALAPQLAWQPWVPAGNKATARTLVPKVAAPKKTKAATTRRAPKRRQTQADIREELQRKEREEKKKKEQQRRERELRAQKLAVKRMEREAELKEEQQRRERDERAKRLPAKRKAAQDLLDAKRMKKN